jgi:hypothetical protein
MSFKVHFTQHLKEYMFFITSVSSQSLFDEIFAYPIIFIFEKNDLNLWLISISL